MTQIKGIEFESREDDALEKKNKNADKLDDNDKKSEFCVIEKELDAFKDEWETESEETSIEKEGERKFEREKYEIVSVVEKQCKEGDATKYEYKNNENQKNSDNHNKDELYIKENKEKETVNAEQQTHDDKELENNNCNLIKVLRERNAETFSEFSTEPKIIIGEQNILVEEVKENQNNEIKMEKEEIIVQAEENSEIFLLDQKQEINNDLPKVTLEQNQLEENNNDSVRVIESSVDAKIQVFQEIMNDTEINQNSNNRELMDIKNEGVVYFEKSENYVEAKENDKFSLLIDESQILIRKYDELSSYLENLEINEILDESSQKDLTIKIVENYTASTKDVTATIDGVVSELTEIENDYLLNENPDSQKVVEEFEKKTIDSTEEGIKFEQTESIDATKEQEKIEYDAISEFQDDTTLNKEINEENYESKVQYFQEIINKHLEKEIKEKKRKENSEGEIKEEDELAELEELGKWFKTDDETNVANYIFIKYLNTIEEASQEEEEKEIYEKIRFCIDEENSVKSFDDFHQIFNFLAFNYECLLKEGELKSMKNIKIYKRLSLLSFITQLFIKLTKIDQKLIQSMEINKTSHQINQHYKELCGKGKQNEVTSSKNEETYESDDIFENDENPILNDTDVSINCRKLIERERVEKVVNDSEIIKKEDKGANVDDIELNNQCKHFSFIPETITKSNYESVIESLDDFTSGDNCKNFNYHLIKKETDGNQVEEINKTNQEFDISCLKKTMEKLTEMIVQNITNPIESKDNTESSTKLIDPRLENEEYLNTYSSNLQQNKVFISNTIDIDREKDFLIQKPDFEHNSELESEYETKEVAINEDAIGLENEKTEEDIDADYDADEENVEINEIYSKNEIQGLEYFKNENFFNQSVSNKDAVKDIEIHDLGAAIQTKDSSVDKLDAKSFQQILSENEKIENMIEENEANLIVNTIIRNIEESFQIAENHITMVENTVKELVNKVQINRKIGEEFEMKIIEDNSVTNKIENSLANDFKIFPTNGVEINQEISSVLKSKANETLILVKKISDWSELDVQNWLVTKKVATQIIEAITPCDGLLLVELFQILKTAPEFFYSNLRIESKASVKDLANFSSELRFIFNK